MPTDSAPLPALLTLAQWLSPAFPVGAFSFSHGLEWAVETGEVTDAQEFCRWLSTILLDGAGRNDAILLVAAYHAHGHEPLAEIDALARALAPSSERLTETAQQGDAFARTVCAIWPLSLHALTYPVAVGAAAQAMNLPLADTLIMYLHGFASNLTSGATRLVPLGQTAAQAVLAAVAPLCCDIAAQAQRQTIGNLGACTFMADIASMKHQTQYSRLFQS